MHAPDRPRRSTRSPRPPRLTLSRSGRPCSPRRSRARTSRTSSRTLAREVEPPHLARPPSLPLVARRLPPRRRRTRSRRRRSPTTTWASDSCQSRPFSPRPARASADFVHTTTATKRPIHPHSDRNPETTSDGWNRWGGLLRHLGERLLQPGRRPRPSRGFPPGAFEAACTRHCQRSHATVEALDGHGGDHSVVSLREGGLPPRRVRFIRVERSCFASTDESGGARPPK